VPGRFAYQGQGRRDLPEEPAEQIAVGTGSHSGRLRAGPASLLHPVSVHLPAVAARQEAAAVADVPPATATDVDRAFHAASPAIKAYRRQDGSILPDVAAALLVAAAASAATLTIAATLVILPAPVLLVAVLLIVGAARRLPILLLPVPRVVIAGRELPVLIPPVSVRAILDLAQAGTAGAPLQLPTQGSRS